MNKTELVKAIAAKADFRRDNVKEVLDAMQEVVFATLKDEDVKIMDGVTLSAVYKEAHEARNPKTGETFTAAPKYLPKVKFGTPIKNALNA